MASSMATSCGVGPPAPQWGQPNSLRSKWALRFPVLHLPLAVVALAGGPSLPGGHQGEVGQHQCLYHGQGRYGDLG